MRKQYINKFIFICRTIIVHIVRITIIVIIMTNYVMKMYMTIFLFLFIWFCLFD